MKSSSRLISTVSPCFAALLLALMALSAGLGGCSSDRSTATREDRRGSATVDDSPHGGLLRDVEQSHVIGPAAAAEINYRVAWQYSGGGRNFKHFSVQGDSAFVLDSLNFLTRITIQDGKRVWRMQIAEPIEEVLGVTFEHGQIYVMVGSAVLVLDPGTGSQVGRQPLLQIANTAPAVYGQHLIYGSRNGQVVWHSANVGQHWRGYQIANSVQIPPLVSDNFVIAVGNDGSVLSLGANSARQFWSKKLLAPVVAPPAAGNGIVYVAGLDQYLWAFDISSGRNYWKFLTANQLTDAPVLIGERVYQQVPNHGLSCFDAHPEDALGGHRIWTAPAARGNVIMQRRAELFVWDQPSKRLTLVEAERGSLIKTLDLPSVTRLLVSGERQDIYALGPDGRVVRLVARN